MTHILWLRGEVQLLDLSTEDVGKPAIKENAGHVAVCLALCTLNQRLARRKWLNYVCVCVCV